MQQYGWVLFALIVLGPLAGALLLDRLRLGRMASMAGLAVLIGGAVALVLHNTNAATGTSARIGLEGGSAGGGAQSHAGSRPSAQVAATANRDADAKLVSDRINQERANQELGALREHLASLGAERQRAADALIKARADLDAERATNAKSRQELGAVRGHLASLEASAIKSELSPAKMQSDLESEREAHVRTRNELQGLREQLAGIEAAKTKTVASGTANVLAVLDSERGAHEKTRLALKAADELAASHDAARKLLDDELRKADAALKAARADTDGQRAKLARAEADLQRLESSLKTVKKPAKETARAPAAALVIAPTPFSAVVASAPVAAPAPAVTAVAPNAASVAPGAQPAVVTGSALPLRAAMDAGLSNPNLVLQVLPSNELVQGQPGNYYRVVCRDTTAAGKRLVFDAGGYSITGGDAKIDPCFKALQATVLSALPAGSTKLLYTKGHASTQAFARPQKLDPLDAHMKALTFLPRTKDGKQFAAKAEKQAVATTYLNKQLPVMRSGAVSDWVSTATKGAIIPALLEGEFKDSGDEASRSFDFIVYVKW